MNAAHARISDVRFVPDRRRSSFPGGNAARFELNRTELSMSNTRTNAPEIEVASRMACALDRLLDGYPADQRTLARAEFLRELGYSLAGHADGPDLWMEAVDRLRSRRAARA